MRKIQQSNVAHGLNSVLKSDKINSSKRALWCGFVWHHQAWAWTSTHRMHPTVWFTRFRRLCDGILVERIAIIPIQLYPSSYHMLGTGYVFLSWRFSRAIWLRGPSRDSHDRSLFTKRVARGRLGPIVFDRTHSDSPANWIKLSNWLLWQDAHHRIWMGQHLLIWVFDYYQLVHEQCQNVTFTNTECFDSCQYAQTHTHMHTHTYTNVRVHNERGKKSFVK